MAEPDSGKAQCISLAGVVGAGGAGFPTQVKLDARVDLVLANGASCEPLLIKRPVPHGGFAPGRSFPVCNLAMAAVGASRGRICLKKKHPRAVEALAPDTIAADRQLKAVEVFILDDFYPAGDEQVLVYEVTRPGGARGRDPPPWWGRWSQTWSRCSTSHQALDRRPVTHRYLTVCGEVARPMVARVPLGISLGEVIDLAGGAVKDDYDILVGGPMMGKVADSPETPVDKTCSGVIVLPKGHYVTSAKVADPERIKRLARMACCQCSRCTDLCPRNLLGHSLHPHKIMRGLAGQGFLGGPAGTEIMQEALLCSECGACEKYACPMMISPREVNAALKKELLASGTRPPQGPETYSPSSYLNLRRIPTARLMERLQIARYDVHPQFVDLEVKPGRVVLPLKQHLGAPAKAVVKPGEKVAQGDLVGEIPPDSLGARVHASMGGTVERVDQAVVIKA